MLPARERLKDSKLIQWALAYLASAWLALQVADVLGDTYGWPAALLRSLPLLLGVGLLVVLVLAWYHGERGAQRVTASELILLSLLLALAATGVVWARRGTPDERQALGLVMPAAENSIAVLPLSNLSGDPDQEYFSDGLSEELLIALAHIPGLRVAARTSSFAFKGESVPVGEIGRALGVRHVLEGSVRRSGDRVRINLQLVGTEDGYQLWSGVYDRELRDIVGVQEEISRAVANALPLAASRPELPSLVRGSTRSVRAHDLYLLGRHAWNRRTGVELRRAIEHFEQAVRIDPGYARAHAALAETYAVLPGYEPFDPYEAAERVEAAATAALKLDPELAEAYNALGVQYEYYRWHWTAAEAAFRRALEINPSYATAYQWYGEFLTNMGRGVEGEAALRRALELDPLSPIIQSDFGQVVYYQRDYQRAIEHLERLLGEHPEFPMAHLWLLMSYIGAGRYDEAEAVVGPAARLLGVEPAALQGLVRAIADPAHREEALRLLDRQPRDGSALARFMLAACYALLGAEDPALDLLEDGYRTRRMFLAYLHVSPAMDSLRSNPRYQRLLRRLNLPPPPR